MALFAQCWVLTRKNLLIAGRRHAFATTIRAFILPIAFIIFLSYARNLFIPPSTFGIGTSGPIRSFEDALQAATGGRNTVAFVNNGLVEDVEQVIDTLAQSATGVGKSVVRLQTEAQLLDTCRSSLRGATSCYGAVVFYSSPGNGGVWNYTLRFDGALGEKINVKSTKRTNDAELFLLPLQLAVDSAIVTLNGSTLPLIEEYPYTSITEEQRNTNIRVNYQGAIINILGVAFLIGMVGVQYHLTGFISSEQELGMSQLIEAMMPNLQRWQPQFARFISYHLAFDIIYLPGWVIMGLVLGASVFAQTSMAIVIIYHVLAGLSLTSFSLLGASFFKRAQLSGITVAIVTLLLGVLTQVINKNVQSGAVAILSLLFVPCNYVFFIVFMARYERQDMATDLVRGAPNNPWSFPGIAMWIFLIIQIFAYPLIGAYVERLLVGTSSKGRSVVGRNLEMEPSDETVRLEGFTKHYPASWLNRTVTRLWKTPKPTVVAVDNLSLSASKGHVLVLLGGNGSGKSTTLNSIAGLNTVTSGSITVNGKGGIGIAPQKNVLWDELTPIEHIKIFNHLKSPSNRDSKDKIHELIKAIDLDRKKSAKSKTLSGGQKRKLQLGMMFTGGSSVCCVDEISSGLDPLSRRKIWDIILGERGRRTIILTTHFLDEADLLADQIVILSKGTLRAQGSSAELKNTLGGGYRISHPTVSGSGYPSPKIDGVTVLESSGDTLYTASTSSQATKVIKTLESKGLFDYQLSGPTIEDVFLRLADEVRSDPMLSNSSIEPLEEGEKTKAVTTRPIRDESQELELHTGQRINAFRQGWVLFLKRFILLRHNYLPYAAAFLIPVIAAGLVTLFLKNFESVGCSPVDQALFSSVEGLTTPTAFNIVVGPSSRLSEATLLEVFHPILPGIIPNQSVIDRFIHTVDTLDQFNAYINSNFSEVTPAGFFLGDGQSPPTLAYQGDGDIYNSIFGLNILDIALSNISISTQYASFDIPWAPGTGHTLQLVVYFGLAMAAYPGFFSLYPNLERTRNIRDLEYSNGVRSLPLWLAYLCFDFLIVLSSSAISVIIFAASSNAWYHVGYLFVIFLLYGIASILLSYVISLFAKTQLSAYAFAAAGQAILFLVYLIGYLVTLTYAPINKIDSTLLIVHFTISLVMPIGNVVRALFVALNIFSTACSGKNIASYPGGILQYGGPILYLIIQVFVLFAILLWYDSGSILAWYRRIRRVPTTTAVRVNQELVNDETKSELARVTSENDGLRVLHLTKSFGKVTAVDNLTFGIKRGEIFALLGPNGAGKTSTISLIRGDIQPSKNGGSIFIDNVDISKQRAKARSYLGVCPQFDAMDSMTVREHLEFYARIHGVSESDIRHNIEAVIKAVGLQAFVTRMGAQLSGGNQRKLSLGIALIGNPTVLLLDEPSSGQDAAAKRAMWKTLASITPGRSLLLTTHSMEEADALASRAGIMAKRMLAVGTSEQLRKEHGDAYYVHLVMKSAPHTTDDELLKVKSWIHKHFFNADVEDKTYHGQIRFAVPVSSQKIQATKAEVDNTDSISGGCEPLGTGRSSVGSVIALLEDHRDELGLEFYSVSPTTLDQVFLTIVKKHDVEEEGYAEKKKLAVWARIKELFGKN